MASLVAMAANKGAANDRAAVALATLAERSGATAPDVGKGRLTDHSHHEQQRIVADAAVTAFVAEQLAGLAGQLDALRAEVAALTTKKGK